MVVFKVWLFFKNGRIWTGGHFIFLFLTLQPVNLKTKYLRISQSLVKTFHSLKNNSTKIRMIFIFFKDEINVIIVINTLLVS